MILQASLGSWLSVASTVFASVAAVATIVAVIYARKMVNESKAATKAMADQHREQIAELKASAAASHAPARRNCWNAESRSTTTWQSSGLRSYSAYRKPSLN